MPVSTPPAAATATNAAVPVQTYLTAAPGWRATPGPEVAAALGILLRANRDEQLSGEASSLLAAVTRALDSVGVQRWVSFEEDHADEPTDGSDIVTSSGAGNGASSGADNYSSSVWVGVVTSPETMAMACWNSQQEHRWRGLPGTPFAARERSTMVGGQVFALLSQDRPLVDILGMRYSPNALDAAERSLALSVWWGLRRGEGHSEESARFLLALIAHPSVIAHVRYDRCGTPTLAVEGRPLPTLS